jgi:hypothetical protein
MKKIIIFILMVCVPYAADSQPVMKLSGTVHDFGKFKEDAGRQSYDFIVSNTGNAPLVIQNIVASCGCTTPEWTREPIPAGGKGVINAIYDPKNRPGAFDKTLTVYSNSVPNPVTLRLRGEVEGREKTTEELFTFPVGPVRFESNHMAFTNIRKTEKEKVRVMQIINTSADPVKVEFEQVPPHLALKVSPATLAPGKKGIVEGKYDATKNDAWGNVTDYIRIKINGKPEEKVFLFVSANLVEDFSSLTREEIDNAPVFKIESTTVDLGKVPGSSSREVEFRFMNEGKSDLIIRHVRSTCGCTAVQQGQLGVGIKPGESSSIKAVFNTGSYKGKVTKAIYVYTNDPKKSEVVLMLNAEVEQPGSDAK